MTMKPRDAWRLLSTTLAGLAFCAALGAQPVAATAPWPTKPVKILVGFPGGSTPDIAARALADTLSKTWGQPVVVDNRPGASGNVAADAVEIGRAHV